MHTNPANVRKQGLDCLHAGVGRGGGRRRRRREANQRMRWTLGARKSLRQRCQPKGKLKGKPKGKTKCYRGSRL
jgi:hypothetical protein